MEKLLAYWTLTARSFTAFPKQTSRFWNNSAGYWKKAASSKLTAFFLYYGIYSYNLCFHSMYLYSIHFYRVCFYHTYFYSISFPSIPSNSTFLSVPSASFKTTGPYPPHFSGSV